MKGIGCMRLVYFTHSLVSDWNHGNVHFLRGVLTELEARGHTTVAYEPADGWSRANLLAEQGPAGIESFRRRFRRLTSRTYGAQPDLEAMLDGATVVIVHEWTDPALVSAIGAVRRRGGRFLLLFHDTHHRAISADREIAALDLDSYDAVLAFGEVLSETYRKAGWGHRVFTWHEAADIRLFHPYPEISRKRDLVWIGNWGDGERCESVRQYLIEPARHLQLRATAYGVRYPDAALEEIRAAGFGFGGWLANTDVPRAFAAHRATVHIPRRPYVEQLPGIPTIRVFEALACGIPLVCAPWNDVEGLFRPGEDFLIARSGEDMQAKLRDVIADRAFAKSLARSGLDRIRARHSCAHRVDELLAIVGMLRGANAGQDKEEEMVAT